MNITLVKFSKFGFYNEYDLNGQISKVAIFVSMIVDVVWVLREPDIQHAEGTNDRAAEKLPPVTGTHPFHLSL